MATSPFHSCTLYSQQSNSFPFSITPGFWIQHRRAEGHDIYCIQHIPCQSIEQSDSPCAQDARLGSNTQWPGLGRSSGEAIVGAAAKWTIDKFREECAVPPLPSSQGVHLMLASRRLPLYIGGLYRKLQRCLAHLVQLYSWNACIWSYLKFSDWTRCAHGMQINVVLNVPAAV